MMQNIAEARMATPEGDLSSLEFMIAHLVGSRMMCRRFSLPDFAVTTCLELIKPHAQGGASASRPEPSAQA